MQLTYIAADARRRGTSTQALTQPSRPVDHSRTHKTLSHFKIINIVIPKSQCELAGRKYHNGYQCDSENGYLIEFNTDKQMR